MPSFASGMLQIKLVKILQELAESKQRDNHQFLGQVAAAQNVVRAEANGLCVISIADHRPLR